MSVLGERYIRFRMVLNMIMWNSKRRMNMRSLKVS
jgi:hypothetical protein